MNGLSTEAEVWDAIKPILRKWARGSLTEADAWFLLNCFESVEKPESGPLVMPSAVRQKLIGERKVKSRDSLAIFALACHKDTQTIRRWCKAGIIPGAYQTPGGHWRVKWTPQKWKFVGERIANRTRQPKSVFHSRRWKTFKQQMFPVFKRKIPALFDLDAELHQVAPHEFRANSLKEPTDRTLAKFLELHQKGGHGATDYLELRLAARSLRLDAIPVTAAALAQKLGTTRRTLFRRFQKGLVRQAIKEADKPLETGEQTCEYSDDELDHQHIVGITTHVEPPARQKPTQEAKDLEST
jgi:hypothetical protein